MATGLPDIRQTSEAAECSEECSGKKKSKFKTFKNFFAKKKRKDPAVPRGESSLKPCQSSSDVNLPEPSTALPDSEAGSQSSIGNRAVSHDSIFIPEVSISNSAPVRVMSQENMPGRVKALQLQLQQNIHLASPGMLISAKKADDTGTLSEDDGLPRSPPEISSLHAILRCSTPKCAASVERHSSLSLGGTGSEDEEQISSKPSSRPLSPLSPLVFMTTISDSLPVDFSSPANPFACLDNSAAKHKIAVNPRRQKFFAKLKKPTMREDSKIPKFILIGSKDEGDSVMSSASDSQDENKEEIDLLAQHDDLKHETNGDEFAETVSKSSKILEVPHSHSPEPEDTSGNAVDQNGAVLPTTTSQQILDPEALLPSDSIPSSEKHPNIQGLLPGMMLMHDEDFKSTFEKSCTEKEENAVSPLPVLPMAITESEECSETINRAKGGAAFENMEEDMQPFNADTGPSEERITVEIHTEESEVQNGANAVQSEHGSTSKQTKVESSVVPPDDAFHSFKETGQEENILTDELRTGETVITSLLNNWADNQLASCNELTDNIGFISEVPLEELLIQSEPSTPQLLDVQGQSEHSIPDVPLQKDNRLVNQGSVKFSIASAWQRSLLEAKRKHEGLNTDCSPLTPHKPELCKEIVNEVSSNQGTGSPLKYQWFINQPLKMKYPRTGPASAEKPCLQNITKPQTKSELDAKGNPFGVKLRRTSPLHKYSTESNSEHVIVNSQQAAGSKTHAGVQTSMAEGIITKGNRQAETATVNTTQKDNDKLFLESHRNRYQPLGKADSVDVTTELVTQEKDNAAQDKSERKDLQTQLDFGKASERKPQLVKCAATEGASSGASSSEPVWVSMARQKQKGFQGQYSGTQDRPQPLEDRFSVSTDMKKEATKPLWGKDGNKSSLSSFQSKELKTNVKEEDQSNTKTLLGHGSQLQPKAQACGMGIREKRPTPNVKIAPLVTVQPPWLAIAKKKAKAWSDMPQAVQ
ncbi:capping protein-inhibiting regulator of actin dynamics [Rhincodon typus]|uniref:capping protein-inhibiting regulator of actin dynamics n=1 Tax=Rhincodon typus TaxID=259920 RepID=UPI00202F9EE1|nr:capping protein-inhibiting regulator of actin dynamics [Rhincodon typus]